MHLVLALLFNIVLTIKVVFAVLQPEYRSWNDKVQLYLINEHIPWCKPYGIYTDKFDEMLRQAQIGKVLILMLRLQ